MTAQGSCLPDTDYRRPPWLGNGRTIMADGRGRHCAQPPSAVVSMAALLETSPESAESSSHGYETKL